MSRFTTSTSSVANSATGERFWTVGQMNGSGLFMGAGMLVTQDNYPETWDQAGWLWLLARNNNNTQSVVIDVKPCFFDYWQVFTFSREYDGCDCFFRFNPVPWVGVYNLFGIRLTRIP